MWCHSALANKINITQNKTLFVAMGCLPPIPVRQFPILASTQPAELRPNAAIVSLAGPVIVEPNHLLHNPLKSTSEPFHCLKFRNLFVPLAERLLAQCSEQTFYISTAQWRSSLPEYVTLFRVPLVLPGQKKSWARIKSSTGVRRHRETRHRWVLESIPESTCGARNQIADHHVLTCPFYRASNIMHCLANLNDDATA